MGQRQQHSPYYQSTLINTSTLLLVLLTQVCQLVFMIMLLLTQFLLDIYGWRRTMLIIAALNTHTVAIRALSRPVPSNLPDSDQLGKQPTPSLHDTRKE